MPEVYTLPGTVLPPGRPVSPLLLFHKWQRYDRFEDATETGSGGRTHDLEGFKREETALPFLRSVAEAVQTVNRDCYRAWHTRFARACEEVGAEQPPLCAATQWRMVVGWATNPALETGLTLDHLLGFPLIPGSAVKGMLHRVAEEELLVAREERPSIPEPVDPPPPEPPQELVGGLTWAAHIKALFGSLHLEPGAPGQPEAPRQRLAAWRAAIRGRWPRAREVPEAWRPAAEGLARLCEATPAGGMVTCFDAVPAPESFDPRARKVLCPDVLTPHTGGSPTPLQFLAVRDGVRFELRYRLADWPAAEPRDDAEQDRAAALAGWNRKLALEWLSHWTKQALSRLGAGGKTTAGYGYFHAGPRIAEPALLPDPKPPGPPISEEELKALEILPNGIDSNRATSYLDDVLRTGSLPLQAAVVHRFVALFPNKLPDWEKSQKRAKIRRARSMRRHLDRGESP